MVETTYVAEIHWLGEAGPSRDPKAVGGKAANLSRLAAEFTVPPGFCVVGTAGESAPADERIATAYQALSRGRSEAAVAVRSSAVDEDSAEASFAGQHETFLNVRGTTAVVAAVGDCVASFHSDRARAYRRQHGLGASPAHYAVLVQELVTADVAGVAFSMNPISGEPDHVVINASWGLGESVVGGIVTPDTYTLDTRTGDIGQAISDKRRMTVAIDVGTAEVGVPPRLRTVACLEEAQIRATAQLARDLEESMGLPVDIEFAWAAGQLFLLQCRPVTTLDRVSCDQHENRDKA